MATQNKKDKPARQSTLTKKTTVKKTVTKKTVAKDSPFKKFFKEDNRQAEEEIRPARKSPRDRNNEYNPDKSTSRTSKSSRDRNSEYSQDKQQSGPRKPSRTSNRPSFSKHSDTPHMSSRKNVRFKDNASEGKKTTVHTKDSNDSTRKRLFDDDHFLQSSKGASRDFGAKDNHEKYRDKEWNPKSSFAQKDKENKKSEKKKSDDDVLRLNKFVAQSGLCSRRKAAEMVKGGEIWVNGKIELNPAYETKVTDVITHKSIVLKKEEKLIYLLMNKPKNTITTAEDEKGRKTVFDLLKNKIDARLFPVGRLDRNTTGLLLLTNDGDLAKKLSHPSHQIKKVYIVETDINVKQSDIAKINEGLMLEDGLAEVDACNYIDGGKKNEIGIEIHSGKNRIVRRIFESLGYEVVKLDRTYYAGLTKKDLPRGFSRPLTEKEIIMLKHFTNQRLKD